MSAHKFSDPKTALEFILAGKARVTLKSLKSGSHFTYRVQQTKDKGCWFISVLGNGDNEGGYFYMGYIRAVNNQFVPSAKATVDKISAAPHAFNWMYEILRSGKMPQNAEVWHEGTCGRCNRALTHPESIETGFGPECVKRKNRK